MYSKSITKNILRSDVIYYFLLHLSSAFMLSAAHNVLYFVLDIKLFVTQFLQFLFTFLFLNLIRFGNYVPLMNIPTKPILYAAIAKFLETFLSAFANSHNRTGELFLVRSFDFLTTFCVVGFYVYYKSNKFPWKPENFIMIPLAASVSISWLEPGQLEYTLSSFISAFLLPFARAASLITIRDAYETTDKGHLNAFVIEYTRLVSILLFLPALLSYANNNVEVTASWESIDYVLMSLSFVFMICFLYSELWMTLSLNPKAYLALDNTKYLLASCAQWIIQNMANPSLIAFGAKIVGFSCIIRIWTRVN